MDKSYSLDKSDAVRMNQSSWIVGLDSIPNNKSIILYPTNDSNNRIGRIYIALPADKLLTYEDKKRYNLI